MQASGRPQSSVWRLYAGNEHAKNIVTTFASNSSYTGPSEGAAHHDDVHVCEAVYSIV
jgi:hypothetical protein